jgi:hypothetical protein
MGAIARVALFLGGMLIVIASGVNYKGQMHAATIALCVALGVIEVAIGALLMLTAALGKLPW